MKRVAEAIRAFAGFDPPAWLLEARLSELGLDGAGELDRAQLERLADSLRVGETRFFRHKAQVAALCERILPERARASLEARRPLRAWSAGCATGEEAWTIAMLLDEAAIHCEVLGTDLSPDALSFARAASYRLDRVADVPDAVRARWFEDGTVRPAFRHRVRFERHNLLDRQWPGGKFDVILCRNVLIYFDAAPRSSVIARLHDALVPGGWLLLGYSEALLDSDGFHREDGAIYRKRTGTDNLQAHVHLQGKLLPAPTPAPPHRDVNVNVNVIRPPILRLRGEYHDHERLESELKPLLEMDGAVVELDGADFLGDEAARVLQRAQEAAPGLRLRADRQATKRWMRKHGLR